MSSTQVNVFATSIVKPEFVEEFISFFKTVVQESNKEDGVIKYDLNQDFENKNIFYIYEEYKSMDALEYHKTTPHFLSMLKFTEGKILDLQIKIFKPIQ
ncbi:hypothetical protein DDB_G0269930 [Dictyostelium discoideum AX4]|uniref:ABM domain-containing protein n=1 Tax=Dictyostelium discoideum TaxID=44689 RepID=Q55CR9_DICDI|nr:hypothetical protein DDB_G0269930 [Dictyostelium discoideum AX4]EAL72315.1 hypothetical protein DDB_G0269930 [Dictyostelium discoideum AX4]|eukprot:XP_646412.1 hypothetical protein DDB_G0269930 [Dictyostelium discoideum AX4]